MILQENKKVKKYRQKEFRFTQYFSRKSFDNDVAGGGLCRTVISARMTDSFTLSLSLSALLRFVETALASGSDTALLTTKKLIVDKLNGVLKTRCEVPNPNHVVNIKFMSDKGKRRRRLDP